MLLTTSTFHSSLSTSHFPPFAFTFHFWHVSAHGSEVTLGVRSLVTLCVRSLVAPCVRSLVMLCVRLLFTPCQLISISHTCHAYCQPVPMTSNECISGKMNNFPGELNGFPVINEWFPGDKWMGFQGKMNDFPGGNYSFLQINYLRSMQ